MPRRNRTRTRTTTWKVTGRLERASPRYGFVVTAGQHDDVYVPARHLRGALDGDEVEVQVRRSRRSGLLEGRVERVVHRPQRQITGRVAMTRTGLVLLPDSPRFPTALLIGKGSDGRADEGDRVVAVLESRQTGEVNRCRVVEVLGDAEDPRLDSIIVARELGIPTEFGPRTLDEVAQITEGENGRPELRDHNIFTIDPADAHDFDDAVSVRRLGRDTLEVGVHIADVSSYVDDGTGIDFEAMERGNSVYLPDSVFPMLPVRLSNELCSLAPGAPKLCVSILMEMSVDGRVLSSRFMETKIRSSRRFTYDEVQAILDGDSEVAPELQGDLKTLNSLAEALLEKRRMRDSVDLEIPEVRAKLGQRGIPESLFLEGKTPSTALIEELMILANAEIGRGVKQAGFPLVYRVHPPAKREKIEGFLKAAAVIGARGLKLGRRDFRRLSLELDGSLDPARKRLLNSLFIRTMEKARYDMSDSGHYGLALEGYCHFTSPIRRYADLLNHRIVKRCLVRKAKRVPAELEAKLPAASELCTEREIRADQAERDAIKIKALRYMEPHLGEVFEGIIVGVVNSGLFVELSENWVEGMVSRDSLRDDTYYLDEDGYSLVGERKGRRYSLGQSVRVQVARVEPLARVMDLVLTR